MTRWIAGAAVAAAALTPYAAPAHATIGDPTACVIVWQDGTLAPFTAGPVCAPFYTGAVNCQTVDLPVTNLVKLHVMVCFPR